MHRHHPVLAHSLFQAHLATVISGSSSIAVVVHVALHVLEQQLPQQLRRVNYRLPLGAVGAGHNLSPKALPRPAV